MSTPDNALIVYGIVKGISLFLILTLICMKLTDFKLDFALGITKPKLPLIISTIGLLSLIGLLIVVLTITFLNELGHLVLGIIN